MNKRCWYGQILTLHKKHRDLNYEQTANDDGNMSITTKNNKVLF